MCLLGSFDLTQREGETRLTFGVAVAEGGISHVAQLHCSFRGGVAEEVALGGVELGSGDDFCELFHVGWLDVQNVCRRKEAVSQSLFSLPLSHSVSCSSAQNALKLCSLMPVFQRLMRRSSALRKVSSSELMLMELMW